MTKPAHQKSQNKLPSISRFITELPIFKFKWSGRLVLIGVLYLTLIIAVVYAGLDLYNNVLKFKKVEAARQKTQQEIKKWEEIAGKHTDYRDAYYKLAVLQYQMGNTGKAKLYLQRVLDLDPNFEPARNFEKILN